MPLYENVFIARQDISSSQVEALTAQFAGVIAENGGTVKKQEYWGLRTLAFRIKKNRKGHYTLFNIEAPAAAVLEMERQMGINEDVLRHLTVRVDELEEGPSAVLQSRQRDRDGRDGDRGGRDGRFRDRDDRGRRDDRPRRDDRGPAPASADGAGAAPASTETEGAAR